MAGARVSKGAQRRTGFDGRRCAGAGNTERSAWAARRVVGATAPRVVGVTAPRVVGVTAPRVVRPQRAQPEFVTNECNVGS